MALHCALQAMRACLGAVDDADAVSLCLVAEHLAPASLPDSPLPTPASPPDVTLTTWWGRRMPPAAAMSDQAYLTAARK